MTARPQKHLDEGGAALYRRISTQGTMTRHSMKPKVLLALSGLVLLSVLAEGAVRLNAAGGPEHQIGPNVANPAYIVVNTRTQVTFTTHIADSTLWRHEPLKVVVVRVDAFGRPIDIVGRMLDNGQKGDAKRNDHIYTLKTSLDETSVGEVQFRVAALFRGALTFRKNDDDEYDWDRDLRQLNEPQLKASRLLALLRRLQGYELSEPLRVQVWQKFSTQAGVTVGVPLYLHAGSRSSADGEEVYAFDPSASGDEATFVIQSFSIPPGSNLTDVSGNRFGIDAILSLSPLDSGMLIRVDDEPSLHYVQCSITRCVDVILWDKSFATSADFQGFLSTMRF